MTLLRPVILCGGSGTRLWPLSRGSYPKQFMDISGDTLFSQTLDRIEALPHSCGPLVVCNEQHRFLAAAILQSHDTLAENADAPKTEMLLEPTGRNTAPAIALAALAAQKDGQDPLLLVLSSDHIIQPQEAFVAAVQTAITGAEAGKLVVFGIPPLRAETGFGYIQQGEEILSGVRAVTRFVEKPTAEKAAAMLDEGGFSWNSGMFLFRASVFLEELQQFAPDVYAACCSVWQSRTQDRDFTRFDADSFAACPATSIDYAVMEHTTKACLVPLAAQWNDMGSWEAFYETTAKDAHGNACVGDVVTLDTNNCYLHSSHRMLAILGLSNISVVETADAVLVLDRKRSQDVKILLDTLKKNGRSETDTHVRVHRPWGSYEVLALGDRFQVKRIIVTPGSQLSLQMHHHRAEHWVVVRGTAKVTVGEQEVILREDQSSYIPLGTKHRLENPGCIPLEIIEIQTGSYLGEDDIVRFEDTYGR